VTTWIGVGRRPAGNLQRIVQLGVALGSYSHLNLFNSTSCSEFATSFYSFPLCRRVRAAIGGSLQLLRRVQVPEAFRLCQQALESLECDADSDSLKVALDEAKAVVDFAYNDTGALYKVAAVLCNFRLDPITESALPAILQMFKELFPEAKDQQEVVEEWKTEYSQFAADLKKLRNTNSTQYWIAERTTFRHLSRLALSVIAIPATTMDIFTGLPDSKKIVELIEGLEEGGEGEKDGDSDEEMRKDMLSWCRKNLPKGDQVLVEESLRNLPVV